MDCHVWPDLALNEIFSIVCSELHEVLWNERISVFLAYLGKNWYSADMLKVWGRRSEDDGIPLSHTPMLVEGHWYMLKRHYRIPHNGLRVDFILYNISTKIMNKFESDYKLLLEGIKTPAWYRFFEKSGQGALRHKCSTGTAPISRLGGVLARLAF